MLHWLWIVYLLYMDYINQCVTTLFVSVFSWMYLLATKNRSHIFFNVPYNTTILFSTCVQTMSSAEFFKESPTCKYWLLLFPLLSSFCMFYDVVPSLSKNTVFFRIVSFPFSFLLQWSRCLPYFILCFCSVCWR